ncbi:protein hunchback [Vigna radiata var. radiata]|uniref:Protein hunchback n=1 Tax=Vigna radiata var. radiata TaxID=3916 RepID=A0A1S3V3P1_VIGRR|nr:protein hunchback [Vigna radiata var. radiata]
MEYQCTPLAWEFYYQEEGLEDLKHSLLYTTLELEATIASAKEEITRRECDLIHVNDLLSRVTKERDEAQAKCQKLMLEKLELQQQLQQKQQMEHHQHQNQQQQQLGQTNQRDTSSQSEEELQEGFSEKHCMAAAASSDCEENSMPSSGGSSTPHPTPLQVVLELAEKKALPEKGKLLKAVVEAGPLLQTLLLAGPLPQWQHPPPQLNSIEIPPVAISPQDSSKTTFPFNNKRDLLLSPPSDCPVSKSRKVITQHLPTPTTASHHSLSHPSFS